jgi:glycosyltransferase involved in cell wall biosynthesis
VIAPSDTAAATLLAAYPTLADTLRVVGHGIDDSPAAHAAVGRHRDRAGEGPLLAVGRFADMKGTEELFAALRLIIAAMPNVDVVVAGGVPANPRSERRWLEQWQRTSTAAARKQVRFVGWLDAQTLAARYTEAAAVLISSRYETFGLVALEAMLHGVPVVATAAGAIAELVTHDRTGFLSPVGDAAALARHAVAVLSDPALARRLSAAAAAEARAGHLWEHVLPKVLNAYP